MKLITDLAHLVRTIAITLIRYLDRPTLWLNLDPNRYIFLDSNRFIQWLIKCYRVLGYILAKLAKVISIAAAIYPIFVFFGWKPFESEGALYIKSIVPAHKVPVVCWTEKTWVTFREEPNTNSGSAFYLHKGDGNRLFGWSLKVDRGRDWYVFSYRVNTITHKSEQVKGFIDSTLLECEEV